MRPRAFPGPIFLSNLPSYVFALGGSAAFGFGVYEALTPGYPAWGVAMQFAFAMLFAYAVFIDQMEYARDTMMLQTLCLVRPELLPQPKETPNDQAEQRQPGAADGTEAPSGPTG